MRLSKKQLRRLRRVRPLDVAAYLSRHGWKKANEKDDVFSLWRREDESEDTGEDLLLPLRSDFRDYPVRLAELLELLASTEQRDPQDILEDLDVPHHDVVRIEFNGSRLSLIEGSAFLGSVRDLLLAAACAAIQPRAACPPTVPAEAVQFLDRVEISHFDAGSLLIKSLVPPKLEGSQGAGEDRSAPYPRRVIVTLVRGLGALRKAARRLAEDEPALPMVSLVAQGVNADLCEALAALFGEAQTSLVSLAVTWASGRPLREHDLARRIVISDDALPWIETIGRECRRRTRRTSGSQILGGELTVWEPIPSAWESTFGEAKTLPPEDELRSVLAEHLKPVQ